MGGQVGADFLELEGQVAEEGGGAVGGGVVRKADVVDVSARVGCGSKVANGF